MGIQLSTSLNNVQCWTCEVHGSGGPIAWYKMGCACATTSIASLLDWITSPWIWVRSWMFP